MQDVDFDGRKACFGGPDGARSGFVAYDLLVGADGANSAVRRLMQVRGLGPISAPGDPHVLFGETLSCGVVRCYASAGALAGL